MTNVLGIASPDPDFNMTGVHSYDQYLQTVRALDLGPDALQQAYRRMVFNVMAVNRDDHTKNFAFLRRESGDWELAPAFDVTHAYNPRSRWTSRHLMSVNGKFEGIGLTDLHDVGDRNDVPAFKRCVREVRAAVHGWRDFAAAASVSALRPEGVRRIYELGLDHNPQDLEEAVTGESRAITTALEPSTLARIDFQIIEELARRHLGWAQLLITYFYAHLLHVQADAYRMRFITPEQRYRSIVDEHPRWPARVKQRDLAAYLGVSEVGLSRIASRVLRSLNGS